MSYTNIPKPIGTTYSNVLVVGKQHYDEPTIIYDSPTTFYDGVNFGAYTKLSKPIGTTYVTIPKPV